ncbi:hypothetical protein [Streptomyces sp. SGAir0957]
MTDPAADATGSPFAGTVAVISNDDHNEAAEPLKDCVHWLRDIAGIDAVAVSLSPGNLAEAPAAVRAAAPRGPLACLLLHTSPGCPEALRQVLHDENLLVVTDDNLRAVTVAAQVLNALRRTERPAGQSSVLLAGSDQLAELGPLLVAVGIFDLIFWKNADAPAFPLGRVAASANIVVDLVGAYDDARGTLPQDPPQVIRKPALADSLTALPGLLTAAADTHNLDIDTDVLAAVAQLLATTSETLPLQTPDEALTSNIEWVARQAMRHPRGA